MTESEQPRPDQADPGAGEQPEGTQAGGQQGGQPQVVIVGPDGQPVGTIPASVLAQAGEEDEDAEKHITELVEQPAKVMRIGGMIKNLLEEVKSAPLDEASRARLKEIHHAETAPHPGAASAPPKSRTESAATSHCSLSQLTPRVDRVVTMPMATRA